MTKTERESFRLAPDTVKSLKKIGKGCKTKGLEDAVKVVEIIGLAEARKILKDG